MIERKCVVRLSDEMVENIILFDTEKPDPYQSMEGYELREYLPGHDKELPYDLSLIPPPEE